MALVAYHCEKCNKEFREFYKSLKDCKEEAPCPDCATACKETFGVPMKQSYGYRAMDE